MIKPGEAIDSRIFGPTRMATVEEQEQIQKLVEVCPVSVFAALNRKFNAMGLMITIDTKQEPH